MANRTTNLTCVALVGAELFVGVTMLAGYQAWVEPGAPRHKQQAAPAPVAIAVSPAPPPLQESALPAPTLPAKKPLAAVPVPAARKAQPPPQQQPKPVKLSALTPAEPAAAPVPVALPQPQQLAPTPAPAPAAPPPNPVSITQRGIEALNARDFTAAVTLLRQARAQQPGNPDLGYLLGMALEKSGEPGAAIDAFRSCTAGPYESIARSHVKALAKRLGKQ